MNSYFKGILEGAEIAPEIRKKIIELAEEFECKAYDEGLIDGIYEGRLNAKNDEE